MIWNGEQRKKGRKEQGGRVRIREFFPLFRPSSLPTPIFSCSLVFFIVPTMSFRTPQSWNMLKAHFTCTADGNEAGVDLVLIQTFLLFHVIIMLFLCWLLLFLKRSFHKKTKEVCIKIRSTSAFLQKNAIKWSAILVILSCYAYAKWTYCFI